MAARILASFSLLQTQTIIQPIPYLYAEMGQLRLIVKSVYP